MTYIIYIMNDWKKCIMTYIMIYIYLYTILRVRSMIRATIPCPYSICEMTRFYLVGDISAILYVITSLSLFLDLRVISTLSRADTYMGICNYAIEFIIRSIERECIYYICHYAMNDRSISSPQFKRLVLPSLSGYRLVLRRSRRTKANGKAGPKLRGWVERSANC